MPRGRVSGTLNAGFSISPVHSIIDNFAQMGWRRAIGVGGRRGVRRARTLALNKSKPPAPVHGRRGIIACEITRWILPPCSALAPVGPFTPAGFRRRATNFVIVDEIVGLTGLFRRGWNSDYQTITRRNDWRRTLEPTMSGPWTDKFEFIINWVDFSAVDMP